MIDPDRDALVIEIAPNRPWEPECTRGAVRGRIIVRLAPGEMPERIPSIVSVMRGRAVAQSRIDNRVGDIVNRFSPAMRVATAFAAAETRGDEQRWDDIEHATGLARTLRIDVDPDASLVDLVSALNDLAIVEQASPQYLSVTPFDRAGHHHETRNGERPAAAVDPRYAHDMIGAREALAMEPGDTTLIVAIVDSGVDLHHPELRERLRPGIDTVDLPANGVPRSMQLVGDWSGIDRQPQDYVGHGTACAGIIGARGELIPEGLAGAARMLAVRVLAAAQMTGRPRVTALGAITDIDLGMKTGIDLGARVLNLSFGTPETALRKDDPRPHADIVAYARRRGCVLVAASGNSGDTTRYYPACLDGVIAVGAVGADRMPTAFMTRGDHVDLCAPGERIVSTGIGGLQLNTGTSFAAPFVAGACALLLARAARLSKPLSGDDVRDLLMSSASSFPRGAATLGCGTGVLDVPAALRALEAPADDEPEEPVERTPTATRAPRQARTRDP